jgi:hypothetical protein
MTNVQVQPRQTGKTNTIAEMRNYLYTLPYQLPGEPPSLKTPIAFAMSNPSPEEIERYQKRFNDLRRMEHFCGFKRGSGMVVHGVLSSWAKSVYAKHGVKTMLLHEGIHYHEHVTNDSAIDLARLQRKHR